MDRIEKRVWKRVEDLDSSDVIILLEQWEMTEFVEFARERALDGRALLDVTEGIVKLWQPKVNAKKFVSFIEDLKINPEKYLNKNDDCIRTEMAVSIESQYQTVRKVRDQNLATNHTIDELLKRIVPAKSFLYRNQLKKGDKVPSYLPMDSGAQKKKKFFRISSYEYPFFDIRSRFSKQESVNDRYYSMKTNSRYYIQKTCKISDSRPKYKSLTSAEEFTDKYPEDHFYEDLCYNDVEKETDIKKESLNQIVAVKPCMVKIQELFQSFKMPFFKKTECAIEDIKVEVKEEERDTQVHLYENSDSISNMYDSVHVIRPVHEAKEDIEHTKLPVEDYLEPVQLNKDYCDVSYKQRDDSLLGYIMSIFENRFGYRRETNDSTHSEESDAESHKVPNTPEDGKWEEWKGKFNMADRPLPVPVENEAYYMNIDRGEAENLLRGQPDGTFVLRPSSQPNHAYTLTVSCSNAVHNVGVRRRSDGRLALGFPRRGERSFPSVTSLLRHHRKRRLLLVAAGGLIGGTTLNEAPHYYQVPSSLPVVV